MLHLQQVCEGRGQCELDCVRKAREEALGCGYWVMANGKGILRQCLH